MLFCVLWLRISKPQRSSPPGSEDRPLCRQAFSTAVSREGYRVVKHLKISGGIKKPPWRYFRSSELMSWGSELNLVTWVLLMTSCLRCQKYPKVSVFDTKSWKVCQKSLENTGTSLVLFTFFGINALGVRIKFGSMGPTCRRCHPVMSRNFP